MTGEELKEIRTRLALTQTQLAELVGVTRNSIARQERNEIGIREPVARLVYIVAEARLGGKVKLKSKPVKKR